MPFQIAIPSYKRPGTLVKKTLKMLSSAQVPQDIITIFVASQEEAAVYSLPGYKIVVGLPGINHQRSFIESYYPPGTHVLCIDDDVRSIKGIGSFMTTVERCFEICASEGAAMWGVNPCSHTLGLKDEYIVGLSFCIGSFHGLIIKEPRLETSFSPFCEDFFRSVECYRRDGRVVRFNGLAPVTSYAKEPGGLQEFRTAEGQHAAMVDFKERYPTICRLRERDGKMTDVRLKTIVHRRVALGS